MDTRHALLHEPVGQRDLVRCDQAGTDGLSAKRLDAPWACLDQLSLAFRFSGECPGPRESTADHLSRPDDLLGHLGVQDRPHASTTVVSTALATGLFIRRSDLPPPGRGAGS